MECTAECRMCGVKVSCKDENIFTLGSHMLKKHPELEMLYYEMANCNSSETSRRKPSNKFSLTSTLFRKSSTIVGGKRSETKLRKGLYKTTVESWRPGASPLTCPKCRNTDQPYIRKQRNKVAYNSLGAFFLLGCWPLCFFPMLMSGNTNTIICCRKCGFCFGTYNKSKGQLIPSPKDMKVETPNVC